MQDSQHNWIAVLLAITGACALTGCSFVNDGVRAYQDQAWASRAALKSDAIAAIAEVQPHITETSRKTCKEMLQKEYAVFGGYDRVYGELQPSWVHTCFVLDKYKKAFGRQISEAVYIAPITHVGSDGKEGSRSQGACTFRFDNGQVSVSLGPTEAPSNHPCFLVQLQNP